MELPNRFVRSATAEFYANHNGTVTEDYFPLYEDLAKGGVGLIIQGHVYVLDEGKAHDRMAGILDEHQRGLQQIVNLVHDNGTKIAAQLNHGGIHSVSTKAPSANVLGDKPSREMTEEDIEEVISAFGTAAARAKKIGYDAVQIHAAHGYLVSQFLSERTNQRTDSWGGSIENRARILQAIYQEIRKNVGNGYPVLCKMNGSDDPFDGYAVEEAIIVAKWLADEGLDALEISGMKSTRSVKPGEEAYFAPIARRIKKSIRDMPLILVGGLRSLEKMQVLRREFVDFISMARPFIREPDLVLKFKEGVSRESSCISCNKCLKTGGMIRCLELDK